MTTKNKYISLAMITILMFFMIILGLNVKSVFAFNGIPNNLTEQELYNETNTYNVSVTTSTTDSDRINNTTQYSVTYNMSQKNSNQVMNTTQITVLTHRLGKARKLYKQGKPFKPDFDDFLEALYAYSEMEFKYGGVQYEVFRTDNGIWFCSPATRREFKTRRDFIEEANINGAPLKLIWNSVTDVDYGM